MAGMAHAPKDIDESIVQARAAAARALGVLCKKQVAVEGTVVGGPDRCTSWGMRGHLRVRGPGTEGGMKGEGQARPWPR